ncbi:hypothetical protein [Actinophytocola xinjiangensis]|nr:hypothetical protein [Actinophytocola xinjiangensis]
MTPDFADTEHPSAGAQTAERPVERVIGDRCRQLVGAGASRSMIGLAA